MAVSILLYTSVNQDPETPAIVSQKDPLPAVQNTTATGQTLQRDPGTEE